MTAPRQTAREIAPCPFCGEPGREAHIAGGGRAFGCTRCGASTNCFDNDFDALDAWNRRAKGGAPAPPCPCPCAEDVRERAAKVAREHSFIIGNQHHWDETDVLRELKFCRDQIANSIRSLPLPPSCAGAAAKLERAITELQAIPVLLAHMKEAGSWNAETIDRTIEILPQGCHAAVWVSPPLPPTGWRGMAEKLAAFVRWTITTGSFEGLDIDGWAAQVKAVQLGILTQTQYDPAVHGPNDIGAELGDPWYVFSEPFKSLEAAHRAPASPENGWMGMDSAPRDGTWILGWADSDSAPYRISWGRNHNGVLAWCSAVGSFVEGYITHWMPLPPAPEQETK